MKNKKKKERKIMKILAFETSCDETSVAVVEDGKKILSNIISTQIDIHKEFGGVVPEIASRHHIENILPVFTEALEKANCQLSDIDYIAVTNTPGLIGSLLVGLMFAKSLSYANNIPLLPVNHINGHIFSSFIFWERLGFDRSRAVTAARRFEQSVKSSTKFKRKQR